MRKAKKFLELSVLGGSAVILEEGSCYESTREDF
jgi:hypothetical protein